MQLCGKNSESGRSLIELLGVLVISGMITAAAFVLIRSSMASQKRATLSDNISEIVTGVRTLYAEYDEIPTSFNGAKTLAALSIDNAGPYSGSKYELARDISNKKRFVVKITGLSTNNCTVLATAAWPDAVDNKASCSRTTLTITYNK